MNSDEKKCPYCGGIIKSEAIVCLFCNRNIKFWYVARHPILTLSVLIAGLSLLIFISGNNQQTPKNILLNATATWDNTEIIITNKDKFSWTNVEMYLNDIHVLGSDFTYKVAKIRPGETSSIFVREFTTPDGTRFNTDTTKIMHLYISCTTPKGKGSAYWGN